MLMCIAKLARHFLRLVAIFQIALDAKRVQINAHVDNHKSIAVAKRCHFTHEATMKNERLDSLSGKPADSVLYACTDVTVLPPLNVNWSELDENI